MKLFIQVLILLFITCAGAQKVTETIITASVGSTAVLPCDCSKVSSEPQSDIEWRKDDLTVFHRVGSETDQGKGYEGRVDVSEAELKKGNCSLVLKNIRPEDEGVYNCYLKVKRHKRDLVSYQTVELIVKENKDVTKKDPASNRGMINIPSSIMTVILLLNVFSCII